MDGQNEETPKSAVDEAKDVLAQIKQEKEELQAWTQRAEAVRAEQIVSGKAEAGKAPEPKKEETPSEYKNRIMRGE